MRIGNLHWLDPTQYYSFYARQKFEFQLIFMKLNLEKGFLYRLKPTLKQSKIAFSSEGDLLMNEASLAIGSVVYNFKKLLISVIESCC